MLAAVQVQTALRVIVTEQWVGVGTGRATAAALIANHCAPVEIELISTLTYTARAATVGWRSNAIRRDGHAIQVNVTGPCDGVLEEQGDAPVMSPA